MVIDNTNIPTQPLTMSKKEVVRARKTAQQLKETSAAGFKTKEITIGPVFANVMGIVWGVLLFLPVIALYYNKFHYIISPTATSFVVNTLAILAYILFIPVHEAIHGIFMYLFNGHKKDTIEFGFNSGMPYCTCQAPIKKWPYIIVLAMPTVILGTFLSVITLYTGADLWLMCVFTTLAGGGGDFTIIMKLILRNEKELTVIDHPYKCGYLLLHKDTVDDETSRIIEEFNTIKEKNTEQKEN